MQTLVCCTRPICGGTNKSCSDGTGVAFQVVCCPTAQTLQAVFSGTLRLFSS